MMGNGWKLRELDRKWDKYSRFMAAFCRLWFILTERDKNIAIICRVEWLHCYKLSSKYLRVCKTWVKYEENVFSE